MDGTVEPTFTDETMRVLWSKDPFDHVKKEGSGEMVDVLVRTLDKKEFKCRVSKDISIHDLKTTVARATGVQSQCQRLLSAGKEMSDESRLSDFSQAAKQVVYLVVRFPGASFGASISEKEEELPSTVGEESALRSYAFRGTVTIPVPERSIERVMASLLQRGVVNGGQLQQLAALSANSWRSALTQEEPLRRSTRSESSSHSHSRRRRRDQRGTDRERERESLRRREPALSRHRSPQTLDHADIHERLLEPRLYDDGSGTDYLLPSENANDDNGEILSYSQGYDAVSSMPDLEALVLQPAAEVEDNDYFEPSLQEASSALQTTDWDTIPEDSEWNLPDGPITGKRKHSRLSSGDFPQEPVSSIVRRHRCALLDPSLGSTAEDAPLISPGSLSHLSIIAPDISISEAAPDAAGAGDYAADCAPAPPTQVPIVMSLAAGPRQFISVPEALPEEDEPAASPEVRPSVAAPVSPGPPCPGRAPSTPTAAADALKSATADAAEAGVASECCKEVGAEEKLLLSIDGRGGAAVTVRAHDCVVLTGTASPHPTRLRVCLRCVCVYVCVCVCVCVYWAGRGLIEARFTLALDLRKLVSGARGGRRGTAHTTEGLRVISFLRVSISHICLSPCLISAGLYISFSAVSCISFLRRGRTY